LEKSDEPLPGKPSGEVPITAGDREKGVKRPHRKKRLWFKKGKGRDKAIYQEGKF